LWSKGEYASANNTQDDVAIINTTLDKIVDDHGDTATTDGQDAALLLANQSPGANSAGVTNKFDLDRNGRVNGQDYAFLLANQQAAGMRQRKP
jgi:hypothetical protein